MPRRPKCRRRRATNLGWPGRTNPTPTKSRPTGTVCLSLGLVVLVAGYIGRLVLLGSTRFGWNHGNGLPPSRQPYRCQRGSGSGASGGTLTFSFAGAPSSQIGMTSSFGVTTGLHPGAITSANGDERNGGASKQLLQVATQWQGLRAGFTSAAPSPGQPFQPTTAAISAIAAATGVGGAACMARIQAQRPKSPRLQPVTPTKTPAGRVNSPLSPRRS